MEAKPKSDHDAAPARSAATDEEFLTSEQIDGLVAGAQSFMRKSVATPEITKMSPGPRYHRALETLRKHGI